MSPQPRVHWGQANYEWAMSLKGTMSRRQAEHTTGIPALTIQGWWTGRPPWHLRENRGSPQRTHCDKGHALSGQNVYRYEDRTGRLRRDCVKCKRVRERSRGYKNRGEYHALYNPDVSVAPLNCLWLPNAAVASFILSRYTDAEVRRQLGDKNSGPQRRWYEITNGIKEWVRYDTADRIFIVLGLVVSEMDCEPVFSTLSPGSKNYEERAA